MLSGVIDSHFKHGRIFPTGNSPTISKRCERLSQLLELLLHLARKEKIGRYFKKGNLPTMYSQCPPQLKTWETELVDAFVEAYRQAETSQTRQQILSIFSGSFSKKELKLMLPGIIKWKIDQKRLHATTIGTGQLSFPRPIHRTRLTP